MQTTATPNTPTHPIITWDPLPDDYSLPDDPVDNLSQPLLAAALRESLELAELITPSMLIATNFGLCATVDGKTVVKAPDWVYVPKANPLPENLTRKSYTPNREGDPPTLVIEFLSETEGGEYSVNPNYPYGKWWFYERILQVPHYLIFQPETGQLEHYQLIGDRYESQSITNNRAWIEPLELSIGVWQGTKADRTGYWLRLWDAQANLLLWGTERLTQKQQERDRARQRADQESQRADQESQRADQERQRADQERQRAENLANQLRSLGIEPSESA
jgi:hypothetical protein